VNNNINKIKFCKNIKWLTNKIIKINPNPSPNKNNNNKINLKKIKQINKFCFQNKKTKIILLQL